MISDRKFTYIPECKFTKFITPYVVIDLETTGLNPRKDSIVGIAFTDKPGYGYYTNDIKGVMTAILNSDCQIIMHNAVFDYTFLKYAGYTIKTRVHDTMLLADILNPDRPSLNLKELSVELLGEGADNQAKEMYKWLADNSLDKESISRAPKEILYKYAAEDAVNTFELFQALCQKVRVIKDYFKKHDIQVDPWKYYLEESCALIPVVSQMQRSGVKLDLEATALKQGELEERTKVLVREMTELNKDKITQAEEILHQRKIADRIKKNKTGKLKKVPPRTAFKWDSNDHLKILFLKLYKIPVTKKTKKGKDSVDSTFFESIKTQYQWVEKLLEYKELKKLTSTYLNSLLQKQEGGFIHANFHLAGTATGRFSCSNPNLQNLPKHGEIKSLFIPRTGYKFIYADYSQLELRIAAHLSGDREMCAEYEKDRGGEIKSDLHQRTADTLKISRDLAKNINFAIIYNASGWRIASMMGWMENIPLCTDPQLGFNCKCDGCVKRRVQVKRGDAIIHTLFGKYTGLKNYVDKQREFMLLYKITVSHFGKLRYLKNGLNSSIRSEFNHALKAGFNLPIQSFGASLCKRSMVKIAQCGYNIVNQIHDSILVECPVEMVEQAISDIKRIMETIHVLSVPLIVEPKILNSFEEKYAKI